MLLSLAEQCLGEGHRKAVFIFIKRMGNWGLWPCLSFVISPACLAAGDFRDLSPSPSASGRRQLEIAILT